jgi:hypothetical protein
VSDAGYGSRIVRLRRTILLLFFLKKIFNSPFDKLFRKGLHVGRGSV